MDCVGGGDDRGGDDRRGRKDKPIKDHRPDFDYDYDDQEDDDDDDDFADPENPESLPWWQDLGLRYF